MIGSVANIENRTEQNKQQFITTTKKKKKKTKPTQRLIIMLQSEPLLERIISTCEYIIQEENNEGEDGIEEIVPVDNNNNNDNDNNNNNANNNANSNSFNNATFGIDDKVIGKKQQQQHKTKQNHCISVYIHNTN